MKKFLTAIFLIHSPQKTIHTTIVYVWSQYDVINIEQSTIGYGWCRNQEAKLKIVGGVIPRSNQQDLFPTSNYITSVIVSKTLVLY